METYRRKTYKKTYKIKKKSEKSLGKQFDDI